VKRSDLSVLFERSVWCSGPGVFCVDRVIGSSGRSSTSVFASFLLLEVKKVALRSR